MAVTLPYPSIVFVPLDVLTAEELNQMCQNTDYLAGLFPLAAANIDQKSLCDLVYPVGSVMIRGDDANYTNFLGGEWEKFAAGRVLVGQSSSDSDFNTAGKTGGSKGQELRAAIGAVDADISTIGYTKAEPIPGYSQSGLAISGTVRSNAGFNHSTPVVRSNGASPTTVQPYAVVNYWKRVK